MAGFEHRFGPVHLNAGGVQPTRFHPVTILIIEIIEIMILWQFDNVSYRFRKREAEEKDRKGSKNILSW